MTKQQKQAQQVITAATDNGYYDIRIDHDPCRESGPWIISAANADDPHILLSAERTWKKAYGCALTYLEDHHGCVLPIML